MPREQEHQPAQRIDLVRRRDQPRIDRHGQLLQLDSGIGFPHAILEQDEIGDFLLVMLVLDLANDFLDHVLDRHQSLGAAELVDDDRQMHPSGPHPRHQLEHSHRFGHEERRPKQRRHRPVDRRIARRDEHVLDMDHAHDMVERPGINRQSAVPRLGEGRRHVIECDGIGDGDDVAARHRYLACRAVAEAQQVAQHLPLVRAQVAADRPLALGIVNRFLDLVAKRGLAVVAEDQCAHSAPQPRRALVGGRRHQAVTLSA